jgi:hypothetical protein
MRLLWATRPFRERSMWRDGGGSSRMAARDLREPYPSVQFAFVLAHVTQQLRLGDFRNVPCRCRQVAGDEA